MRERIAVACRVLAARGLADGILGHISVRTARDEVLVRCRGPRERGLAHTEAADIRAVRLDGTPVRGLGPWAVPNELPLHLEVLRARPGVSAVVHAHPPAVIAADLAGLAIEPIVGAYDIPGARLAAEGVPVYPRGVLIRTPELAREMTRALGERPAVVLRGHGLTTTGATPEQAVLRAISVDSIARVSLAIAAAGGTPVALPAEELAHLPDLGSTFNEQVAWRHERARLTAPGSRSVQQF